jgi:hypothetical protein
LKNLHLFRTRRFGVVLGVYFVVVLFSLKSFSISKELAETLPKPDAIFLTVMKDINGKDTSMSTSYWKAVEELCATDPFPKSLCALPAKVKKLNKLLKTVFAKKGNVLYPDDMSRVNIWDVRELTAANFIILPSPQGPEATLKTIVEVFYLRNEILRGLSRVQADIKKKNPYPDAHMLLTIPFIRASIYAASPMGAALTMFNSMRCRSNEKLCDILKSRQGGVINVLVEGVSERIHDLKRRIELATNDEASDQMRRLRLVLAFAEKIQDDQKILTREELLTGFTELAGSGQGGYADESYQSLARNLVILAEALLIEKMAINFTPYVNEINKEEKLRTKKLLLPMIKQSLDAVEKGFVEYGVKNGMGE